MSCFTEAGEAQELKRMVPGGPVVALQVEDERGWRCCVLGEHGGSLNAGEIALNLKQLSGSGPKLETRNGIELNCFKFTV